VDTWTAKISREINAIPQLVTEPGAPGSRDSPLELWVKMWVLTIRGK
jgi:hypothetical protein